MHQGFHWPHWHLKRPAAEKVGVKPLYWNIFLLGLAQGFTGIYIPLYLVQLLLPTQGLVRALSFLCSLFLLERIGTLATIFPAARLARAIGFRWTIFAANLLRLGAFGFFLFARDLPFLAAAGTALMGGMIALYWPSFNTLFAEDGAAGHIGRSVSFRILAEKVAGIVTPVLGGLVVAVWGFGSLFSLGMALVLLSSIPLFFMKHHQHADEVSGGELKKWLRENRFRKAALGFVGYHVHAISLVAIWPVYVFGQVGDYRRLGLVFSVTALAAVIMSWFAGRWFDRKTDRRWFKLGNLVTAFVWFVRGELESFKAILAVDSVEKVPSAFFTLPYLGYVYGRARGKQAFSFMVYMEVINSVGAVGFWAVALILVQYPWFWYGLFGLAGLGVLMSRLIVEKK